METRSMTPKLQVHEPPARDGGSTGAPGSAGSGRPGVSKVGWLALVLAFAALFLALEERLSSSPDAIRSLNQSYTATVLPQLRKASDRQMVGAIHDLKRMMVTLDEIKELSEKEEIKVAIDKVRRDLQELSVKLLVHG